MAFKQRYGLETNDGVAPSLSLGGGEGRALSVFVAAGQANYDIGDGAALFGLPKAEWLRVDRGYHADGFRRA